MLVKAGNYCVIICDELDYKNYNNAADDDGDADADDDDDVNDDNDGNAFSFAP